MTKDDRLRRAYAVQGPDEVRGLYREWADGYEADVVEGLGYVAPRHAARALADALPDTASRVLDVGCGTGLVGLELRALGYTHVDGLDLCPEMLQAAAGKGLYDRLMEGDLTARLTMDDDAYDGSICVGTFTHGHVGPGGLGELIRVTRPGGPVTFTVNDGVYDAENYDGALAALEADGRVRVTDRARADYLPGEDIRCRLITLRVA
ncbi:class I SAM-dependent DNA methyltransferase [Roseospira visakhapatnamensis]|uniref:Putative TPR repeat methyltransferase n=1 Tax=Roseospira visakhapatnamensis TaxID=390880 RepID=A0A7W6RF18_9PROT|nr:class I SAM-dependent methyltransferase [Roseospira visakhapatnamensis]MBB4267340.1 putative TPR repeat methyltransferase [Roseospira visakhapatnamensis]